MFKGKVKKFIVIPICTVEDEQGNPTREEKGRPFSVLIGDIPDLKKVAEELEIKYERDYFSKLNTEAAKLRRFARNRRSIKKV